MSYHPLAGHCDVAGHRSVLVAFQVYHYLLCSFSVLTEFILKMIRIVVLLAVRL